MENKTCGNCWWFHEETGHCAHHVTDKRESSMLCCGGFVTRDPKLTNGDRIRQGGNRALTAYFREHKCDVCTYAAPIDNAPACLCPDGKTCNDGMLAWLNAPAGVCVAENGESAKQTDLYCKDGKESEGEDER